MMLQISQTLLLALTIFFLDVFPSQATVCADETVALNGIATLTNLQQQIFRTYDSELQACAGYITKDTTCTLDFSKYTATSDLKAACTSVGGKILVYDSTQTCYGNGFPKITIHSNNQALCVGQNCTASEFDAALDSLLDARDVQNKATGFAVCTSDAKVETSGSSQCDACFALNMLLFSSLLGSLFLF